MMTASRFPAAVALRRWVTQASCVAALTLFAGWHVLAVAGTFQDRRIVRGESSSERRIALVVGNQAYPRMPLQNAVQDARDIEAALKGVGFQTQLLLDATQRQLQSGVGRFVDSLQPGDVALVFYAGHGIQIAGENYLLPIDFDSSDEASARYSSYSASLLLDRMTERGARLKVIVLDACRNNPFRTSRSAAQGLAAMSPAGRGTFIGFATGPGSTADDNTGGRNGLFTAALLEAMRQPGIDLVQLFARVTQRVDEQSGGRQTPWANSSIVGQFVLRPAANAVPVDPAAPTAPAATQPPIADPASVELPPRTTPNPPAGTVSDIPRRDWPSERPPAPTAAREARFPPYQTRTLKNGLQVIAVSHPEQPAVTVHLIVRAGGSQDPIEKPGVAAFMAGLLDQGTTTKTAEQIANTIDSIGGVIGTGSNSDMSSITAAVMKDSFDLALDLVSDVARNPAFSPDEIDRQRKQILSGLQVSYEDPEYLAGVVFDRLVYGFHPYGKPDAGLPSSIAAITRDDLVKFHKAWFGANNAILAIVGDVTTDEAFKGAERAFSSWGRVEQLDVKPVDPPPPTRRVIVVDRPGAVQTEIRVGNVGLPRKHPDYIALNLAMRVLGGEGGNRLHRVLRSERGLTYGASAELHALRDGGDIVAETDTRSETTAETLRLLVDEIGKLRRERVHPRELSEAQAYISGSFPLTIETPGAIARQIINAVFFGLDLNELQTFRERVNAVTVDDVQRVAQKYLHPDRLSIVLVGDASVFAKQLASMGFDQVERISLADLDLTSPDLRKKRAALDGDRRSWSGAVGPMAGIRWPAAHRAAGPEYAQGTAVGGPRTADSAEALVARVIEAKGGLERLQKIRTVSANVEYAIGREMRVTVPSTISIRYPDRFRVDTMAAAGRVVQVFNKGEYWVQDGSGARVVAPEDAAEIGDRVQRDGILLLLRLASGALTATRVADVAEDGRSMPALRVAGAGVSPITLLVDPASGLILRQRYTVGARQREFEEAFSDYRDVDGIKVAFKVVVRGAGVPTIERTVRSVRYNVPIDPALFVRPS